MRIVRLFSFALLVALVTAPVGAQTPLPVDPSVRSGRLPNGMTYYVRANARPLARAELRLVVNAGSILEAEDQRGLAHFVEHMAFNGTEGFAKQELISYLESIGMRFGADANAYTSFDETVYELTVPTDTGQALDTGLRILEEWAHRVAFDPTEVEKERGVVIEEWRLGRGAASRMRDQSFPVLFRGSKYAERLPIGTRESLETFTREQLIRYYRDWYRPDLMAVVAVGDFDAAEVERGIRERFATIPARPNAPERGVEPFVMRDSVEVSVATDAEATNSIVRLFVMRAPTTDRGQEGYRRQLVESLFDGILNARLTEIGERPEAPFAAGVVSTGRLVRSSEALTASALVAPGGIERGLDALVSELARVERHGFTAGELEREKADMLRAYERAWEERANTESRSYADEYVRAFLEAEPIPGIEFEYALVQRLLPTVTLEEVNALAGRIRALRNRVIVAEAPESSPPPPGEQLVAALHEAEARELGPWRDVVATTPLVPNPPAAGRIVDTRELPEIGVTEWRLANGIRVIVKPTDFKADEVLIRGFGPGGLSVAPDSIYVSASLATTLVSQSGVGDRTVAELRKELAGNSARIDPYIAEFEEGFEGRASPRDLETLLQLGWLYATGPRADSAAYVSLRDRINTMLANRDASPDAAFSDTVQLTLAQYHPRARPLTAERLREWNLDASFAFYQDRFADVGDFTFVFVGAFDTAALRPLVERWLGGLPSAGRADAWRDTGIRPPAERVEKVVRKGIEPRAQTLFVFTGDVEYSAESRHRIGTLADVLDIRLREVLREDLGGTYGASVSGSISRVPTPGYVFQVAFGAEPARLDSLATATLAELQRVRSEGPDAETLAKVKETQRREYETSLRENSFWLGQLARAARDGSDPRAVLAVPQRIDALTIDALRETAARVLTLDRFVRISLHPAAGGG